MVFQNGLRALLRQDPDVLVVGEIRDGETAQIAVRAALTGHVVFSTLHAPSAVEAAVRLSDMGVPAYLAADALTGIVSSASFAVRPLTVLMKVAFASVKSSRPPPL